MVNIILLNSWKNYINATERFGVYLYIANPAFDSYENRLSLSAVQVVNVARQGLPEATEKHQMTEL